jgi:hypothetical protein
MLILSFGSSTLNFADFDRTFLEQTTFTGHLLDQTHADEQI